MIRKIKNNPTIKMLLDIRNIGLYVLAIVTLSVAWSSIKVIQKNYEIEKQISNLNQQVGVLEQETKNQTLQNEYYKTDAFLELAARKYFGLALPGEKFISVPNEVADKYTHPETSTTATNQNTKPTPKIVQNWQSWVDFFLHRSE